MKEKSLSIKNIDKVYNMYKKPTDRIKESFSLRNKVYHEEFYALKDINLEINKGEILGIIGKNGSGKSTLLKIITGVLTQTRGTVEISGKISALLELGTGFNMEYTGMENIYLVGLISGYSHDEMKNKIDEILDFAEIGDFINQPVKTYSSGMFARLAFAVSINVDPDILIVDEALAVGDMKFQLKCMDKFNEFRERGKTILFVTHDINSVKRFCTRAVWINKGTIMDQGDVNRVTDAYLDYLKVSLNDEYNKSDITSNKTQESINKSNSEKNSEKNIDNLNNSSDYINIKSFRLLNSNGEEIDVVKHNEKIRVEIEYMSYGYEEEIVIGAAILRIDNLYVCGLNSLLDKIVIKCKTGLNKIVLEYENINLVSGKYYFDCGIFEKNAYVALDYKTKIKEFSIESDYVGEGIVVLNHEWRVC